MEAALLCVLLKYIHYFMHVDINTFTYIRRFFKKIAKTYFYASTTFTSYHQNTTHLNEIEDFYARGAFYTSKKHLPYATDFQT